MMRYNLFLFLLVTLHASAQISNVHQSVNNGRIVIIYDLRGSDEDFYDIKVTATNDNGETITPRAIVGDLAVVAVGQGRSIWWEMQLDGYTPSGWKISLAANKPLDIKWIFVEGGPGGDYYISATEVTFDQYDKFCEATSYTKPEASFGRGKQPVVNVNVADAVAYCDWLSKETRTTVRLPEEYEWIYAAEGGNKSKGYEYSGSNTVDDVAWYKNNSGGQTHEAAAKKPNELAIYDMSGNVWEWCGTSGAIRGGSWDYYEDNCRVSFRFDYKPYKRSNDIGFRPLRKK